MMQTETIPSQNVRRSFFDTKIEFLKGVGPQKAAILNTELRIFTYGDVIQYYPFRHEDRTKFYTIREMYEGMPYVQIRGKVDYVEETGEGSKKRLIAYFVDSTGEIELLWFQGIQWQAKNLKVKQEYVIFGKPQFFNGKYSVLHPEMELYDPKAVQPSGGLQPVYNLTEKLRKKFVGSKQIGQMVRQVLDQAGNHLRETLPENIIQHRQLISKLEAMESIHFPKTVHALEQAKNRLKFEELFYIQLKLLKQKLIRKVEFPGQIFKNSPEGDTFLNVFYRKHIPFDLTDAQKKVIREIYRDMSSGKQMNRLLQGDVGSGKTIVAFICMLMAIDNGAQACMMAPTEILADQHYNGLKQFADMLGIRIGCLTGSTRAAARRDIHQQLQLGMMKILVGTHALLEDVVQFKNLGLAVIDEQHRFGVAQRARLWQKNDSTPPHVLVMTATPIPRTLAMTLYGDLDVSVIDQLPAGRKPIKTVHRYDAHRLRVFGFMREQLQLGRQVYIVYPLIEESEKMSYKNLMDGYESIARAFPEYQISIVHGSMNSGDKDYEMQRFLKHETHIMVATTVIEVGVNVPNASVMVIESAEKFGLAQLHQLRGRVGRGAEQSYCVLMTDYKLSKEARTRIETMVRTTDGFEISEVDLQLRGPGDLSGTQQSGVLDLLIADLAKDQYILQEARDAATQVLEADPDLSSPQNQPIRRHIESLRKEETNWSRIS
ncbi:ATP-dependent DNA helicase RecG [Xanthocytophaga agilis]|uniref:ATP-dependent DNA helicase RecG n=1 Tax=Xanthocytophaga agilis TaxID=3048010 RepID=A0AAE3UFQ3_9BACT|nr:ATP-dependent DNA helicase RecG [Xanthocytophaga agilis]MDJ1504103.1 ATP-dependent DNA helicase RecG [Xanthocytophaga agilis]